MTMTKDEMLIGLQAGRTLMQEKWSSPQDRWAVNELVAEGKAHADPWEYKDSYQCEVRKVRGVGF